MANPVFVICTVDTWVKVATAVQTGQLWKANTSPDYFQTYKITGDPAPTTRGEGMALFSNGISEPISSAVLIDVYVYAAGSAGRVRVDV